ncbi:MAG: 50S ribosomal protein L18 [Bdellovibrionales bacterium]|nr:50S ribosomal protein L18 [Bdellovibrionales bacterium]
MRLNFTKHASERQKSRLKNKARIRRKVSGTAERPRLAVFRSSKHIYAQLIDDVAQTTLISYSTLSKGKGGSFSSMACAKEVGAELAKKALEKNIKNVVFDRSGYIYHGRIKSIAEGAREAGLNF